MSQEIRIVHSRTLEHPIIWVGVIGTTLGSIVLLDRFAWLALPLILAVVFYYLVRPFLSVSNTGAWPPNIPWRSFSCSRPCFVGWLP